MSSSYIQTFLGVSTQLISIFAAIFIAYQIYLIQKNDDIRLSVRNSMRELGRMIWDFSRIEELRYPDEQISGYHRLSLRIFNKETWNDNPKGIFTNNISKIKEELGKAFHKDIEYGQKNPARRALYISVGHELIDLINKIYQEFPVPPGRHQTDGGRFEIASIIDDEFPENINIFRQWQNRLELYLNEIQEVYGEVYHVVSHLLSLNIESIKQRQYDRAQIPPEYKQLLMMGDETYSEYQLRENNFFIQFFSYVPAMLDKSKSITDSMERYYAYKFRPVTMVVVMISVIGMAVCGLFLPFYYLSVLEKPPMFMRDYGLWHLPLSFFIFLILGLVFTVIEILKNR